MDKDIKSPQMLRHIAGARKRGFWEYVKGSLQLRELLNMDLFTDHTDVDQAEAFIKSHIQEVDKKIEEKFPMEDKHEK